MGILKIWDNFLGPNGPILKFTFLESLRNLWLFGINKKRWVFFFYLGPLLGPCALFSCSVISTLCIISFKLCNTTSQVRFRIKWTWDPEWLQTNATLVKWIASSNSARLQYLERDLLDTKKVLRPGRAHRHLSPSIAQFAGFFLSKNRIVPHTQLG